MKKTRQAKETMSKLIRKGNVVSVSHKEKGRYFLGWLKDLLESGLRRKEGELNG